MKLALEAQEGVTVLVVTEDVLVPHAAILKAGIRKMAAAGKKSLLIDLTAVTPPNDAALRAIAEIRAEASSLGAQIAIASPVQGVGDASTRAEALAQMRSVLGGLLSSEASLKARRDQLEKRKAELTQKLSGSGMSDVEIKALRKSNSDLKKTVRRLEAHVVALFGAWSSFRAPDPQLKRQEQVDQVLSSVLGQENIL